VSSALGGLNNKAGKAANAVAGLLQSFTQGGIWGAAAAGAMLVVNKLIDGFNKAKEASKTAAEFARQQWVKALDNISNNAEIKIKSKVEAIDAGRQASNNATSLKDTIEQQQIEATKKKYAEMKLNVKIAQRQGTYTPMYGSADNDLQMLEAQEKIDIAKIHSKSTKRKGEKKIAEYNDSFQKAVVRQKEDYDVVVQKINVEDELKYRQQQIQEYKKARDKEL